MSLHLMLIKIRVSNDNEQFHDKPIDVTSTNIDQAVSILRIRKKRGTSVMDY